MSYHRRPTESSRDSTSSDEEYKKPIKRTSARKPTRRVVRSEASSSQSTSANKHTPTSRKSPAKKASRKAERESSAETDSSSLDSSYSSDSSIGSSISSVEENHASRARYERPVSESRARHFVSLYPMSKEEMAALASLYLLNMAAYRHRGMDPSDSSFPQFNDGFFAELARQFNLYRNNYPSLEGELGDRLYITEEAVRDTQDLFKRYLYRNVARRISKREASKFLEEYAEIMDILNLVSPRTDKRRYFSERAHSILKKFNSSDKGKVRDAVDLWRHRTTR